MMHPPVARASVARHVQESPIKAPSLPEDNNYEDARAYILARATSSCGSENSYYDAPSEVGSFVSAASSFADASEGSSPEAANGKIVDDDNDSQNGGEQWESRFMDEHEARLKAEAAATELASAKDGLERRVEELQNEVVQQVHTAHTHPSNNQPSTASPEETADVAAARMVAGVFARVIAREETEQTWAGEVQLLRQRVERSAMMESIAQQQRQQQQLAQEATYRRAMNVGFAVGCLGLGAVAAFLVVRSSRK